MKTKKALSSTFKRYITIKKNKEIIKKMSTLDYFDIDTITTFNYKVDKIISSNPKGNMIMMDVNDLYECNMNNGNEETNKQLKNMIDSIKDNIPFDKYEFAKRGDELYLYIPNKTKEDCSEFMDILLDKSKDSKINSPVLSLSAGSCDNQDLNYDERCNYAEDLMKNYKDNYKKDKINYFFKKDKKSLFKYIIDKNIQKARINVNTLKEQEDKLNLFSTNFDNNINSINFNELMNEVDNESKNNVISENNNMKKIYRQEALEILGENCDEKLIDEYILAQLYSRGKINGTITNEYFQNIGYKNINSSKNIDLLTFELSGLKKTNDEFGYAKGDEEISNTTKHIQQILEYHNIDYDGKLVLSDSGSGYIPLTNSENPTNIINNINNYSGNLKIFSHIQSIPKEGDLLTNLNKTLTKSFEHLDNINNNEKIQDNATYTDVFKNFYKDCKQFSPEFKSKELKEIIQIAFKDLIEEKKISEPSYEDNSLNHEKNKGLEEEFEI